MKVRLTSLALIVSLLLLMPLNISMAKDSKVSEGVSVPVTGTFTDQAGSTGRLAGTLTILRFAAVNNRIHAVGVIRGTLTDSRGSVVTTGLQTVSLPVTLSGGQTAAVTPARRESSGRTIEFVKTSSARSAQPHTAPAAAQGGACEILRLATGAIDLNLLGLTVHLDPVLLVISAVPGAGNLLGNLLCAIVGLLDGVGTLVQITQLLNQLLGLLGSL